MCGMRELCLTPFKQRLVQVNLGIVKYLFAETTYITSSTFFIVQACNFSHLCYTFCLSCIFKYLYLCWTKSDISDVLKLEQFMRSGCHLL